MIKDIYKELVSICKEAGVTVSHFNKVDNFNSSAAYVPTKRAIYVKSKLKNTKEGVYVLSHEIGHAIDHAKGFHKTFFEFPNKIFPSNKSWEIIKKAETSASRRGVRLLRKFGLDIEYPTNSVLDVYLKPKAPNSQAYLDNWKSDYFYDIEYKE